MCVFVCHTFDKLAYILHEINTTRHDMTRHTPFHPIIRSFLPHFFLPSFLSSFFLFSKLYCTSLYVQLKCCDGSVYSQRVCAARLHIYRRRRHSSLLTLHLLPLPLPSLLHQMIGELNRIVGLLIPLNLIK